ncbi:MAG TPA: redoxin domain-containing protein [Terriglobales bacterium]|nr:redoxin domain-containing protein [Terriglobales bacterium]
MRGVSSEHPQTMVRAGEFAPDFDLPVLVGGVKKRFHLKEQLELSHVVLAFYPLNWEAVSARQLVEYQVERRRFVAGNTEVVGISVDSIMNTTEWEREIGPFDYPLGSDFWPHGEVSRAYGVFREHDPYAGASERAIFVVERGGKIRLSKVYHLRELPPLAEMLEALRGL